MRQTKPARISAKKLASLGGKIPFTTITGKRKARRKRPHLTLRPKQHTGFLDSRSYVTTGGRVRLFGKDYENLRSLACLRSIQRYGAPTCECGCERFATWGEHMGLKAKGELSHNEHGARKSDELNRVKWMRHECHMKSHNCNGKPITARKKDINGSTNGN